MTLRWREAGQDQAGPQSAGSGCRRWRERGKEGMKSQEHGRNLLETCLKHPWSYWGDVAMVLRWCWWRLAPTIDIATETALRIGLADKGTLPHFHEPNELRKVLECGSPLPLLETTGVRKRQGTAALQDAGAPSEVNGPNAGPQAVGAFHELIPPGEFAWDLVATGTQCCYKPSRAESVPR
jgi:hypothetical protein